MTNSSRHVNIHRREALAMLGRTCAGSALFGSVLASAAVTAPGASAARGGNRGQLITRPIPGSGEPVPVVGLGTSGTFEVGASDSERAPVTEVLRAFIEAGGRLVDTSPMYGTAEGVIGDVAARLGITGKLFLATKVWQTGKQEGIRQMEASMAKLRVKRLDLIQVHNLLDVDTQLATLAAWKKAGRVRYVGVTHYQAGAHEQLARLIEARPVDFLQINYSAGEREAERRLLPVAAARRVAVIVNRPFARGDLLRRLRSRPLPGWAAEIDCGSWAQILLKYVIAHPAVTCAIPATSKVEHLRDNMKAATGRLPDDKLRALIVTEVERA
jgi:diketogulonate reductase-like aldo/keto reductase